MTDALLTLAEAAKRCGVSIRTMEREARDGKLEIRRLRSVRLIAPAELDRYIASYVTSRTQCQGSAVA